MSLESDDLVVLRDLVRAELGPINDRLAALAFIQDRLNVIEDQLAKIPDLLFLWSSPTAQEVVAALRKAAAKPRPPIEGLMVPEGPAGRHNRGQVP